MNLVVTGEMALDAGAQAWLPGYVKEMYLQAAQICREVNSAFPTVRPYAIPDDAWEALYVKLEVYLHTTPWAEPWAPGQLQTGWYKPNADLVSEFVPNPNDFFSPQGFNRPDMANHTDKIEMFWDSNEEERDRTLRHEFCHMVWRHSLMPNWYYFGHGGFEGSMDPFQVWMKWKLHKIYRPHGPEYPVIWKYPMGG